MKRIETRDGSAGREPVARSEVQSSVPSPLTRWLAYKLSLKGTHALSGLLAYLTIDDTYKHRVIQIKINLIEIEMNIQKP